MTIHMKRCLSILIFAMSCCVPGQGWAQGASQLQLDARDRILIVAPHPDDETIAAAGVIQEAVHRHLPVRVVYVTNGDSNQLSFLFYRKQLVFGSKRAVAMGELRQDEAIQAMHFLGLSDDKLIFLGYPDYGTLNIFKRFWRTDRPYRGTLTRATGVPYKRSLRPGALYTGENILADLKSVLADFKPTKIIVNHPADDNTDHQAAYLFTRTALWDLRDDLKDAGLYTYMVHALGWPRPLGFYPSMRLLPDGLHLRPQDWLTFELNADQIIGKKQAVLFYKSQIPYKPKYLFTFVRANELFSIVGDISLKPQTLDAQAWNKLDAAQQMRNKSKKIDMRHQAVLKSVVYGLEPGQLVVKIKLNQWSRLGFDINVYLLGYKDGVAFADMPKGRLRLVNDHSVAFFDGQKSVNVPGLGVSRQGNDLFIKVPLAALGDPDRIISAATVRVRNWPQESSIWVVLRVE
jgi:LmbE family N-acetylglucosaminyl deacetylase